MYTVQTANTKNDELQRNARMALLFGFIENFLRLKAHKK